jgi:hypothetical protein
LCDQALAERHKPQNRRYFFGFLGLNPYFALANKPVLRCHEHDRFLLIRRHGFNGGSVLVRASIRGPMAVRMRQPMGCPASHCQ